MADNERKDSFFIEGIDVRGKRTYECKLCRRKLASKQNIRHHLFSAHNFRKSLKTISSRLRSIKPPDYLERLPRDLEKHYGNLKATELQAWLLFYSLPCLTGILPQKYLDHLSLLSEAIYLLLGDYITEEELCRAEILLNEFYQKFSTLYPGGSCGLNVHNAGAHLVHFVRLWGPLWAWSCFAFEDANAMVLQSVHGTGNVVNQIVKIQEATAMIRQQGKTQKSSKMWTKTTKVSNCEIAGGFKPLKDGHPDAELLKKTFGTFNEIYEVERIVRNGQRFYSTLYKRMKRRVCYVVLLKDRTVGAVQYFLFDKSTLMVYAVVVKFYLGNTSFLDKITGGKHLTSVKLVDSSCNKVIVPVDNLEETLFFIDPAPTNSYSCVSRVPHCHGRSVFK